MELSTSYPVHCCIVHFGRDERGAGGEVGGVGTHQPHGEGEDRDEEGQHCSQGGCGEAAVWVGCCCVLALIYSPATACVLI